MKEKEKRKKEAAAQVYSQMNEFVYLGGIVNHSLSMEMSRLTRNGTAEPVSRGQILRHERGQGRIHFPCPAHHEQDWQPYPVDPYPCCM